MSLDSKKILEIPITISSKENILEEVEKYLKRGQWAMGNGQKKEDPLLIFTPNPEIIEYAQTDPEFKNILNTAEINLPDGAGTVWAVNHSYQEKITRITGIEFMLDLCGLARKETIRIGLIGGKGEVALRTSECLQRIYPGLKANVFEAGEIKMSNITTLPAGRQFQISKLQPGHAELVSASSEDKSQIPNQVRDDIENIIHWIEEKKIGILFVALGFPKQEYFIENVKYQMSNVKSDKEKPLVLMAVGGSFDYISGRVKRAPVWMRNRGLEWLYRLIKEPLRIKRQLKGARFFWRVFRDK
ncbi:hypothetical protein A3D77_03325 [Candidatus Gottesmanbacteria bacterium RIFCSPHIGHO2_02_FULL_39_11]|uniref:Uncharacterized protein n=1 Tax=Candidatus Gottesmanbacteria bacterium RIFCSPHIGHO2_02_FULL_39_11 TaxID=1798382 RepID=A0A1F5ZNA9_9BACT|nr:MAG: hypothetical protein A3D77_03325 [Candidatus Gottesmanbacteria bacterium RIFCSPHIGHO2_02_FULL_39_11]